MNIVLGTRGSRLALWQAQHIKELLLNNVNDITVDVRSIMTKGDQILDKALPDIGGKGLFTKEIEDALLEKRIDIAVHSLKDLPSELPEGLLYAGSPKRADCRDTFVSKKWLSLNSVPNGGRLATGSMRRKALIFEQNPTIICGMLRGNIETRLRKLEEEDWDGIIMAAAALDRLGMHDRITEFLNPDSFVPAVGQGAIGLEIKESRIELIEILKNIIDEETVVAVKAERAFMRAMEGGCSVPIGGWGRFMNGSLTLTGYFASPDGKRSIRETLTGSQKSPEKLGGQLAEKYRILGVDTLITS
ncbi:MAG: hydroxymethylbilane synthase [Candidatus Marinimicrobia bacterium]|nr:hydroxymethylbilane synthase [Candidatus Neomarinimicrobiota bacterium]